MADLAVAATASPAEIPTIGGTTTIVINTTNIGRAAADTLTATITLPAGAELASDGLYLSYWQCDLSAIPTWTCTHQGLAAGEQAETLAFPLRLPPATPGSTASVGVRVTTTSREVFTNDNTAQAVVTYYLPVPPDLAVGLIITPTEAIAGTTLYFKIDLRNVGEGTAAYPRVDLPVPPNVDAVSPSGSEDWYCNFGRDVITDVRYWSCGYAQILAPGAAASTLVLVGQVSSGSPGDRLTFTATAIPADFEENTANNAAQAGVDIVPAGTVRGVVWRDTDRDGQRDTGEYGIPNGFYGVQQILLVPQAPAAGDPAFTEVEVAADGTYAVALKPGPYVVQVWVQVDFYDFTAPNVGDDATDSDIVSIESDIYRDIGSSDVVDVVAGGEVVVDAGLIDLSLS